MPVACAVWGTATAGLLLDWWVAPVCAVASAVLGAALFQRGLRFRSAGGALVAGGLAAAVLLGPRLGHAAAHPLRAPAERGAVATMRVTLDDRPHPIYSAGFAGRQAGVQVVTVIVTVDDAHAGTTAVTDGRVLLVAPAAGWSALLPGQSVTAVGRLAPAAKGELTVAVLRVRGPPEQVEPASAGQRAAESLRAGLRRASAELGPESGGLLPGLVDGDTSGLLQQVADDFRTAGLSHLTAVSGANLAILCGAALLMLRALRCGPRLSAFAASLALVGFVMLAGPQPSVLRAAVMGGVGLLALALGRERSALPALSLAVVVLVLYDPGMAVDLGFVLSVLATAALVVLTPRWAAGMRRFGVPLGIAEALAVPAAAHLVTAPVIAGFAGRVSLVAVAANLFAAPVVAPATVFGVLAAVMSPLWSTGAVLLAKLAGPETSWLVTVGHAAANLPGASISWPTGWFGTVSLCAVVVLLVLALRSPRLRVLLIVVVLAALVVVIPVRVIEPNWPPPGWAMVDCDVGQGDGEVLATADPSRAVVIDTGPDEDAIDGCLNRLGITRIPLVVLSHLHADHVGGLAAVLAGRAVGAVAVAGSRVPTWAWDQVRKQAATAHVPLVQLTRGMHLDWPGLALDVLGPMPGNEQPHGDPDSGTAINNTSAVLRAETAAGRVLLTGDIELETQADLLAERVDLMAEVLKIPHHGSRYSLPAFLDAVHARVAVASVGAGNSYGHPSPVTLNRLREDGALVLRTDLDGDVAVLAGPDGPWAVRRGDPRPAPHGRAGGTP